MATAMTMVEAGQSCISPITKHNPGCVTGELLAAAESAGVKEDGVEMEVEDQENDVECTESRVPKILFNPLLPSRREVEEHDLTHTPYRNWCPICVAARGKEDPHKKVDHGPPEDDMPEIGMDYYYYGDAEDSSGRVTTLVMKDRKSGALFGDVCETKGPTDE